MSDLIASVATQGLEGIVAKRRDRRYEAGQRSGAWQKMQVNCGQEFVIGGYTPGPHGFDALVFGVHLGPDLLYVGRTRNGFTPSSRSKLFQRLRGLETPTCPFVNLPEAKPGRWGHGLTAAKMTECRRLMTALALQWSAIDFERGTLAVRGTLQRIKLPGQAKG